MWHTESRTGFSLFTSHTLIGSDEQALCLFYFLATLYLITFAYLLMSSVRCTVTLLSNKSRKVEIELRKEKCEKLTWKVIKSSGGSLSLLIPEGFWETNYGDVLSLWDTNTKRKHQKLVVLVVFDIKQDFLDDIINNGTTIVSENAGFYNDNPSETDVNDSIAQVFI